MNPSMPDDLASILNQLATYANTAKNPSAEPAKGINASGNTEGHLGTTSTKSPGVSKRKQGTNKPLSGMSVGSDTNALFATNSNYSELQNYTTSGDSLSVNDHLRRLQEITTAAQASRKDDFPKPVVESIHPDNSTNTQKDPKSILKWGLALRHVSKTGGEGSELEVVVRKMIETQRSNEESWWKGRESLRLEIEKRNGEANDLQVYESKIYKAQRDMHTHMEQRLCELGIPFFGLPSTLITETDDVFQEGKISAKELRVLQKKMLDYLEDMYAP
jgi:hypothetical protein